MAVSKKSPAKASKKTPVKRTKTKVITTSKKKAEENNRKQAEKIPPLSETTGSGNLSIRAGAGTGKSTTLEWTETGVPKGITPSDQQQAIFDFLKYSPEQEKKRKAGNFSVRVACFNVSIMEELAERFPSSVDVRNNHKIALQPLKKFISPKNGYKWIEGRKMTYLAKEIIGNPYDDNSLWPVFTNAIKLADMAKVTLTGNVITTSHFDSAAKGGNLNNQEKGVRWEIDHDEIINMARFYSIDIEDGKALEFVEPLMNASIQNCSRQIDFNDIVWLPNVFGCKPDKVDRLYIDECFPAGTIIETNFGFKPIEEIINNPGFDWKVRSCNLETKMLVWSSVNKAYKTPTENPLIEIQCGKEKIRCTANHPFYTQRGWVKAGLLQEGDSVSYLRQTDRSEEKNVREKMCGSMATTESCNYISRSGEKASGENIQNNEKDLSSRNGNQTESYEKAVCCSEIIQILESNRPQASDSGRQWKGSNQTSDAIVRVFSESASRLAMDPRTCRVYWDAEISQEAQVSDMLQDGYRFDRNENRSRSGRVESQPIETTKTGSEEGETIVFKRVDSVTVSEFRDSEMSNDCSEENRKYVFTLNVEHGNYFANSFLVKNCQDLNAAQHGMLMGTAEQYVIVGDLHQAIYGFCGADPEAMPRLEAMTDATLLPLTMTRRCPHSHVELAKRHLPPDLAAMFKATPDAPQGLTGTIEDRHQYLKDLSGKDNLTLCRTNAPMVQACFALWKDQVPASIRGRDIAANLCKMIKRMKADDNKDLITKLMAEYEPKIEKLKSADKEDLAEAKADELEILLMFATESKTPDEAEKNLYKMFGDKEAKKGEIKFSTVHKAKGLEAEFVTILRPELLPHPGISKIGPFWAQQERNIAYVGETRGKHSMMYEAPQK